LRSNYERIIIEKGLNLDGWICHFSQADDCRLLAKSKVKSTEKQISREHMSDSNFSGLIYRIIGKPERWHDDYIVEMMQQYLDETEDIADPLNLLELAAGEEILSRLSQGNAAIDAFNTLLDKSRFQMIILDEHLKPLYHNRIATDLFQFLQDSSTGSLKLDLVRKIQQALDFQAEKEISAMHALDFIEPNGGHLYIRTISSKVSGTNQPSKFHILMMLNPGADYIQLNPDLVAEYGLTEKEQNVVMRLIHGDNIKQIAEASFVSENTIRSHLKAIFRKTDTKSQGALISLTLTHESQVLDSYFNSDITTVAKMEDSACDKTIKLSCGLDVSYCDYGPEDGYPIIVFHSGFGSRLAIPKGYEAICEKFKKRIIVPDRPGLGKTAFVEGHPDQWNRQLMEFVDKLGLKEYDILGSIIACQMAMSYTAEADPRQKRLILTSPVYLNDDNDAEYLTEILAPAAKYVKMSPQFAKEIYTLWLKAITLNFDAHYIAILSESVGSAEKELFEKENTYQLLTDVFKEGARQSLDGILHEMVYCMTPLHLDLSKITIPVDIWYGTEDRRITREGVDSIFTELPNKKIHIREGYSEHIYYSLFEEIMA